MTSSVLSIDLPALAHNAPIPAAARVGPLICSSGISGKDAATGRLAADGATQVQSAFANLRLIVEAAGARLDQVVKLTVWVKDNSLRDAINERWLACFPDPLARPARHILVYDLQHGMALQLEFMAYAPTISTRG